MTLAVRRSLALCGLALVSGLAGRAMAQAPDQAQPRACDVVVDSRNGGAVQVRAPDASPAGRAAPQVIWRPSASGSGVLLLVTYASDASLKLTEPKGILIEFRTKADLAPDSTAVVVRTANGRSWRFDNKAIHFDKDNRAEVAFGPEWPYGRGVLAAIANNQSLVISVEQDGQSVSQESFALSNIDSRDTLLTQARVKYAAADLTACK